MEDVKYVLKRITYDDELQKRIVEVLVETHEPEEVERVAKAIPDRIDAIMQGRLIIETT